MTTEPQLSTAEITRVLRLYEGPPRPRPTGERAGSRGVLARLVPVTVALAFVTAATMAVVVVLSGGGQDRMHAALTPQGCIATLALDGKRYVERVVDARRIRPVDRGLGDGLLRLCAQAPAEVSATALAGIDTRRAVAVQGGRSGRIYVASPCSRAPAGRLLACLRAP